jgi:hypothetical protein
MAEEPGYISFSELVSYEADPSLPSKVRIRGFLYVEGTGPLILSSEPHVKSCCVHKLQQKVQVFGINPEKIRPQAQLLEGMLKIVPLPAHAEYQLLDSHIIEEQKTAIWLAAFAVLLLIGVLFYFKLVH